MRTDSSWTSFDLNQLVKELKADLEAAIIARNDMLQQLKEALDKNTLLQIELKRRRHE